ncbi:MAG: 2-oxo acid dehydrogenase subunit E2 [Bacilli bacterium]|nr:2-oxo acid dehydrogenase subunit E2 [Bacilli bacterium]
MKKKFLDRRDGTRLKSGGFEKIWYALKSKRSENEVHILKEIDVTELKKYYEKLKKDNKDITYFHLFSTATAKILYNKPLLNRFVINGSCYKRNDISLSFVAKTEFTDDAKELFTVMKVDKEDNLNTISKKILGDVKKVRSNQGNNTDDFMDKLKILPKFLIKIITWLIKFLDNHDLLPSSLTDGSIYHSTVLLSNLGSIHCDGIYHNLTNFGTNSIVVTIGEIKESVKVIDGKIEKRAVCQFGITLDERIADGVYFAKCVNMLEYILNNPNLLEDRVDAKVNLTENK